MIRSSLVLLLAAGATACTDEEPADPGTTELAPWGVPITGGNLLVTRSGTHAVVADPDRDRIAIVELASGRITDLPLTAHDEPGRLAEDAAGRVHVALRRGNAVVTVDPATARITNRRAACVEPRGVAFDAASDSLHIACASGELVTLPAAGGAATRTLRLERDLRDVVIANGQLFVTRFRSAEVLALDSAGAITQRLAAPVVKRLDLTGTNPNPNDSAPIVDATAAVAWRTIGLADGSLLVLHQRQVQAMLRTEEPGGYGGGCGGGPVEPALTLIPPGGTPRALRPVLIGLGGAVITTKTASSDLEPPLMSSGGSLPVDIATNAANDRFAVVAAGSQEVHVLRASVVADGRDDTDCPPPDATHHEAIFLDDLGAPTSAAYTPANDLVVFYPEAPALVIHGAGGSARTISLPGGIGYDAGRNVFHTMTASGLACASCHPEGRDDGNTWEFAELGKRRTQSLAGNILARGPYHWVGDMGTLEVLMNDVFAKRMAGGPLSESQQRSLGPWLDRIPAPASAPAADPQAAARGRALFESAEVGCATCHAGPLLTTNVRIDVGTAGVFKVPSLLGVGARAPFMHDGCAPTLADRFGACGGGDRHGVTSTLAPEAIADLTAYLDTL